MAHIVEYTKTNNNAGIQIKQYLYLYCHGTCRNSLQNFQNVRAYLREVGEGAIYYLFCLCKALRIAYLSEPIQSTRQLYYSADFVRSVSVQLLISFIFRAHQGFFFNPTSPKLFPQVGGSF